MIWEDIAHLISYVYNNTRKVNLTSILDIVLIVSIAILIVQ